MTPEQERERGIQAERLLNDPLLTDAFTIIKSKLEEIRDTSKWDETDLRENIHMKLGLLRKLREYLDTTVRTGKFAVTKLETHKKAARK